MAQNEAAQSLAESTTAGAEPIPQLSQGEQVERILRGESAAPEPQEGTPDSAEPKPAPAREPLTLKALAAKLGMEQTDLYRELKVSAADGVELTLEELKDRYKDTAKVDEDRQAVIRLRGELEADRIAQTRELAKLKAVTPQERADPQMQQAYERFAADTLSREREAMLRTIPEWADPAVVVAERKQLQAYLTETGEWPADAIDHIENHKLFRTLRAGMRDRAELKEAKAELAKLKQPRQKIGIVPRRAAEQTPGQKIGVLKAAVTKGQLTQTAAVERLLTGK